MGKESKISSLLTVLSVVFIIITISVFFTMNAFIQKERLIVSNQAKYKQIGLDLQAASDFLTTQAQTYVIFGEQEYYNAYFNEIDVVKSREKAIQELAFLGASPTELKLLNQAREYSNELSLLEIQAFDSVHSKDFKLAQTLMFGEQYKLGKSRINSTLEKFQNSVNSRGSTEARNARQASMLAFSVAALVMLCIIASVVFSNLMVTKKITAMKRISQYGLKVSSGDFDVDVSKYQTNDEFGILATSFSSIISMVKGLTKDLKELAVQHELGNIDAKLDVHKYDGAYCDVAQEINNMLLSYVGMITEISESLNKLSDGNFDIALTKYPGKKAEINYAVGELQSNLSRINCEVLNITNAASSGDFYKRANVSLFKGDWAYMLEHINLMLFVVTTAQNKIMEKEREVSDLKNKFVINMSHEIRTPMNAIIGLSEVGAIKEQSQSSRDYFVKINAASKNLMVIINDILDFSKMEDNSIQIREENFNLDEVINDTKLVIEDIIYSKGKNLTFEVDVPSNIPRLLIGDKDRVCQILKNILDNAVKFTTDGQVSLHFSLLGMDTDTSGGKKAYLSIIIQDTGIGMKQEQLDKLFVPFEQFHSSSSRTTFEGTGLGMAITLQLLKLIGGKINVKSEVLVGTTVSIEIGFKVYEKTTSRT